MLNRIVKEFLVYDTTQSFALENPFVVKVVFRENRNNDSIVPIQRYNIEKVSKVSGENIKKYESLFPYFADPVYNHDFVYMTRLPDNIRTIFRIYNVFDKKDWFINIKMGYNKYRFISTNWKSRKKIKFLYGREFNRIVFNLKTDYSDLFNHDNVLNWFLFNPNKFKFDFEQETKIKIKDLKIDFFDRKLIVKLQDSMKIILDIDLFINGLIKRDSVEITAPFEAKNRIADCLSEFSKCYEKLNLYVPEQ